MKEKCKICGKSMDISNWVAEVEFLINGTIGKGRKEDIEIIEEYDVCRDCFFELKCLFFSLTQNHKLIKNIRHIK